MVDLRLSDLGTRRAFGMYVDSIIRTRSSLPTFATSIAFALPAYTIVATWWHVFCAQRGTHCFCLHSVLAARTYNYELRY